MTSNGVIRVATRGSALARWQAEHVGSLLLAHDPDVRVELVIVDTAADRRLDVPIWQLGGKGAFVKEVQATVIAGGADIAVHSAKDLPAITPAELVIGAVPERGDPRDALVGARLDDLPPGARVATGSARRRAQLSYLRPDLTFAELRGNMQTRLRKAADHDAIVVAAVALERLQLAGHIAERLTPSQLLPQVAQGALAVECRIADAAMVELLRSVEHAPSRVAIDAERAYLAELGGDCDLPAGAHATVDADGSVTLEGLLASLDGRIVLRHRAAATAADATALGADVARYLLDDAGGHDVLQMH